MNNIEFNNYYKQVHLYEQFLRYLYNLDNFAVYHTQLVKMLKVVGTFKEDAINLIAYVNRTNNGKLPDNLQTLFNEWLLTYKL